MADGGASVDSGAVLTDEQILGIEDASSSTTATPEVQPQPAATPAATPAELSIDQFKPLFATNPAIQSLWDKYDGNQKLVSQFGTVADARKAAETVQMLGGVQHLETLAQKAADVDQTDAVFFSGQPEDRKKLATEWYDGEGPHEFGVTSKAVREQVDATLDIMRERDPNSFIDLQDRVTRQALESEGLPAFFGALAKSLESGQGLQEIAQKLLAWGQRLGLDKGKGSAPRSPDADKLAADRAKLDADRTSFTQARQQEAIQAADTEIGTQVMSEIDKALGELKANGRPLFGPNSTQIRATIAEKVKSSLDDALSKNPVLVAQVKSLTSKGFGQAQAKEMVAVTIRHAKLQLAKVIEQVMEPWTKSVVAKAGETAQRAKDGASRTDVGSGSTSGGSTKPKLNQRTSGLAARRGMTPEQILDF